MLLNKLLFLGCAALLCRAGDWTPIVAKIKTIKVQTNADGVEVLRGEAAGAFLRWSDGTELTTKLPVAGGTPIVASGGVAEFIDGIAGKAYHIDIGAKTATLMQEFGGPRLKPNHPAPASRPTKMINGLLCYYAPIVGQSESKGPTEALGNGWRSAEHNLTILREMKRVNGPFTVTTTDEIYDIQIGTEPSRALVPQLNSFAVVPFVAHKAAR